MSTSLESGSGLDAVFRLIEAIYRLVADPDAWLTIVELLEILEDATDELPLLLGPHLQRAEALSRQLHEQAEQVASSYLVVELDRLGVVCGDCGGLDALLQAHGLRPTTDGRLDFGGAGALEVALREARVRGNALLELPGNGADRVAADQDGAGSTTLAGLCLVRLRDHPGGQAAFELLVPRRVPRFPAALLDASFGLTAAERRVAECICRGENPRAVAARLAVSEATVRNQLKSIFVKTGVKRQPELVLLLQELALLASAGAAVIDHAAPTPAADLGLRQVVLGPRNVLRLPDGRQLCWRELGVPTGRPVLVLHNGLGMCGLQGPRAALARELDLRWLDVERPGFGHSSPNPDYGYDAVAADMTILLERLGLTGVHLFAIGAGMPHAVRLATVAAGRIDALTVCSGRPGGPLERCEAPGHFEGARLTAALRRSDWFVDAFWALYRRAYTSAAGARFLRRVAASSPHDRPFAEDPDLAEFATASFLESIDLGSAGLAADFKAFHRSPPPDVAAVRCPIIAWHGEDDPVAPIELTRNYLAAASRLEFHPLPDTGHFAIHRAWPDIFRRIARG